MTTLADLVDFLDASPSPWHAVRSSSVRLDRAGFTAVAVDRRWAELPTRGYTVSGGALVAWARGARADAAAPLRVVGAHTDSPGLRVKPSPDTGGAGWKQLAVEIYGGPLLNSWLDRDLGIAGQVVRRDGSVVLVDVARAVARVPQLAIHLDREVNERGLVLDKQAHLTPVWGVGASRDGEFGEWLAEQAGVPAGGVAAWDLCLYDRSPAALLGGDADLLASGRLDNQLSCWAATSALCSAALADETIAVVALFDHEEVGSQSTTGAAGPLLERVLEQLCLAVGGSRADFLAQLAASNCFSCDNAHSVHPNYADRHEPGHRPIVHGGPAIKLNHNQRYATSAASAALATRVFDAAGVPWQTFVSRNNMPCGTTIGPITATRLGIATVDVGVPQLSMHSARELCGVHDPVWLAAGLTAWFAGA